MFDTSIWKLLMLPQGWAFVYTPSIVILIGPNTNIMHMNMLSLHDHRPKSAEITMQILATDYERCMLMPVRTQSYRHCGLLGWRF